MDVVRRVNEAGLSGVVPDLVFVLDLEVETALDRQDRPDRIGGEDQQFHQAVRDAYRVLASQEPNRVMLIDNSARTEAVVDRIMSFLR